LTDAIYRKHKECNGIKRIVQLHLQECNGTYSIALLGNGIFYSISHDREQPIKRLEFNKVLYNQGVSQKQKFCPLYVNWESFN
jgi:ribosomal protein L33